VFLNGFKPYVVIATASRKRGQVKPNTKTVKARVLPIPEKLLWIFEIMLTVGVCLSGMEDLIHIRC